LLKLNSPSSALAADQHSKSQLTSIQEKWNESIDEKESIGSKDPQTPAAFTLKSIHMRVTKLEEDFLRQRGDI